MDTTPSERQKVVIMIEKYSDSLDAYSVINDTQNLDIEFHFLQNARNDLGSIKSLLDQTIPNSRNFKIFAHESKDYFVNELPSAIIKDLRGGDIVAMPFVRYIQIWRCLKKIPSTVVKIHLSEGLPETFGHIGYRIGFRGNKLKTWLTLPLAKVYSVMNKADICYFPASPLFKNPFAKETRNVHIPQLVPSKVIKLNDLLQDKKRVLLIGGFGYDITKMASVLGLKEYIATSKEVEIIIDGITYPLKERISAEEVLLGGYVESIVGYTSNVMMWANRINSTIPITCYASSGLNDFLGPFYSYYVKKALKKYGIIVQKENNSMLSDSNLNTTAK